MEENRVTISEDLDLVWGNKRSSMWGSEIFALKPMNFRLVIVIRASMNKLNRDKKQFPT